MPNENICILGGSGFVGRHLASQLAARGCRVTIPTRRRQAAKDLLVLPRIEIVEADVHDPDTLARLCAGRDAVINLVGILHGHQGDFAQAHAELPRKLLEACRTAGVTRLLHMSALGAEPNSRSVYKRSKGEAEKWLLEPSHRYEVAVTVFRPSVIFGPGDGFLALFAKLLRMTPVLPLANAYARFQPVHVADVARAFAEALDDPATYGQAYNLCGPKVYTMEELVRLVAATLGLRRMVVPLGPGLSYWFARLMELKPGAKILTRDNHYAMQIDNVCPEGFPDRFGVAQALEVSLGYLRGGDKDRYDDYRAAAGR